MFRKIPILWHLPQFSLKGAPPSKYTLRSDYSGWKERFSSSDDQELLCTAEVAAAIMDTADDEIAATEIRRRLDIFQTAFLKERDDNVM